MTRLLLAIALTLGVSFVCSLFEAVILSTSIAEIEALKRSRPRRGRHLEVMKAQIDETISAILALNTIGNVLGSMTIGAIAAALFQGNPLIAVSASFGILRLVGSEVLPKNIGVTHRAQLLPYVVYPLWYVRQFLAPVSWLCNLAIRPLVGKPARLHRSDEEIILLAERGAEQGTLSLSESNIIANALSLDDVRVSALMTPRTVVAALRKESTVGQVFTEFPNLPFGRIPVYGRNIDDVVGLVRRRDLLKAKANDQDSILVEELMGEVHFIPETVTVAAALQSFLKHHQKLLVVVDEFGATAGVIAMEDVIEHLLGREIFEKDDLAVDMREFARSKLQKQAKGPKKPGSPASEARQGP